MATKTIRLTDEVHEMLKLCRENESMSAVIIMLYTDYKTNRKKYDGDDSEEDKIYNNNLHFSLATKYGDWVIPDYTKFNKIIRITDFAYEALQRHKMHIDESFNTVAFRLAANYILKNKIGLPDNIVRQEVVFQLDKSVPNFRLAVKLRPV